MLCRAGRAGEPSGTVVEDSCPVGKEMESEAELVVIFPTVGLRRGGHI